MALFEEILEEGLGWPIALGIGALALAPKVLPAVGRILRPVAKGVIKAGISVYDEAQGAVASISEASSDIVTEARHELSEARSAPQPEAKIAPKPKTGPAAPAAAH